MEIYKGEAGTEVQVKPEKGTLWLAQRQMAELLEKDTDTFGIHLKNIYQDGELEEMATTEDYSVVQQERKRLIISVLNRNQ